MGGGVLAWLGGLGAGGEEADPGAEAAVESSRHRLGARVFVWSPPPELWWWVRFGGDLTDLLRLGFRGLCPPPSRGAWGGQ